LQLRTRDLWCGWHIATASLPVQVQVSQEPLIDRYIYFLKKYGQNPSATTQRLFLEATNTAFGSLSFNKAADTGTIEPPLTDDEGPINDTSEDKKQQPTAKKHRKKAPLTPTCLSQLGILSSAL
jgi:hypothetical protein